MGAHLPLYSCTVPDRSCFYSWILDVIRMYTGWASRRIRHKAASWGSFPSLACSSAALSMWIDQSEVRQFIRRVGQNLLNVVELIVSMRKPAEGVRHKVACHPKTNDY